MLRLKASESGSINELQMWEWKWGAGCRALRGEIFLFPFNFEKALCLCVWTKLLCESEKDLLTNKSFLEKTHEWAINIIYLYIRVFTQTFNYKLKEIIFKICDI